MSEADVAVVLAHGAWADGSSWNKVVAALRSEGVKAVAAPLPLTTLADVVTALDRVLERVARPVVLVANAYAGAVIGSVSKEKAASLVYVSALAPDEAETAGGLYYRPQSDPLRPPPRPRARPRQPRADLASRGGVQPGLRPARDGAGASAARRHAAAARRGLHRRPGGAACLAGPARMVPGGRRGPHDPPGDPALHGRADEGAHADGA